MLKLNIDRLYGHDLYYKISAINPRRALVSFTEEKKNGRREEGGEKEERCIIRSSGRNWTDEGLSARGR